MAVVDRYVDTVHFSGKKRLTPPNAITSQGVPSQCFVQTVEVLAADDAGSKYRFFKGVSPFFVPVRVSIGTDGIAGATSADLGFYETDLGPVVDANNLMSAQTLAVAADLGSPTALDGMDAVDIADYGKRVFELAGHTEATRKSSYDIVLTINTDPTATGTVTIVMEGGQG